MFKKIIDWLIMSKIKNAAGEMQASGISVTKVAAVLIGLLQAVEYASPYFGHPIKFDPKIYGTIGTIGGIALKEAIDRSAPPVS